MTNLEKLIQWTAIITVAVGLAFIAVYYALTLGILERVIR